MKTLLVVLVLLCLAALPALACDQPTVGAAVVQQSYVMQQATVVQPFQAVSTVYAAPVAVQAAPVVYAAPARQVHRVQAVPVQRAVVAHGTGGGLTINNIQQQQTPARQRRGLFGLRR
jgi:hypothetical protein